MPYNWTIKSGTLSAVLSLSSSGVISGTPATAGSPTSVTFQVTDSTSAGILLNSSIRCEL
jgi:Putative Ig domain